MQIHSDFKDFIKALNDSEVKYVIIGAFALSFHGQPRATGDIDFWLHPDVENTKKIINALKVFGFESLQITTDDLLSGDIIQLGFPPVRIDLLTKVSGVTSDEIWADKVAGKFGEHEVFYMGKNSFRKNKKAVGRAKDLADLEFLGED